MIVSSYEKSWPLGTEQQVTREKPGKLVRVLP